MLGSKGWVPKVEIIRDFHLCHLERPTPRPRGRPPGRRHPAASAARQRSELSRLLPLPLPGTRCRRFLTTITHTWNYCYVHLRPIMRHTCTHFTYIMRHTCTYLPNICHSLSFIAQSVLVMCFMSRHYSCSVSFHVHCIIKLTSCTCFSTPSVSVTSVLSSTYTKLFILVYSNRHHFKGNKLSL